MNKIKKSGLVLLISSLLAGCEISFSTSSLSSTNSLVSSLSSSSKTSVVSSSSSSESSIRKSSIEQGKEIVLDFYSINDFHGKIVKDPNDISRPGISSLSTYLKKQKALNPEGYVFLNSGDLWQDTYDSAMNQGALLTEAMNVMECEVLALGNHEFDWGIDTIKRNKDASTYTSFLGANIRNYPNTSQSVDFAEYYKIVERQGLRIGIIGGVGENQITSITSSNWNDVTFMNPTSIIKTLSDKLRVEQLCDVIVLAMHCDESDLDANQITRVSSVTNKKYVDAVFNAHSHQYEIATYNNVKFVQAGSGGGAVGHIQLKYLDGEVTTNLGIYQGNNDIYYEESDPEIDSIIAKYLTDDFNARKNEVVGQIDGNYQLDSLTAGRLLATATEDVLKSNNIQADIIINNGCRDRVQTGSMTREKVFNSLPFTNKTIVVKNISGADIYGECIAYDNPYYWVDETKTFDYNGTYTVACIDYVLLHKNSKREYNYFPSYREENVVSVIEDFSCDIVCNYLKKVKRLSTYDLNNIHTTILASA